MVNINYSKWFPYISEKEMDVNNANYIGNSNPHYKAFTGAYVTKMTIPASATAKLNTHYAATEPFPFPFDSDLTIIINPFEENLYKTSTTDGATGLVMAINERWGNEKIWSQGIMLVSLDDNQGSDTFHAVKQTLVLDKDDVDHDNFPVSYEEFGYLRTDEGKLNQTHVSSVPSIGTHHAKEYRIALGVGNYSTGDCRESTMHLLVMPNKARGKAIT